MLFSSFHIILFPTYLTSYYLSWKIKSPYIQIYAYHNNIKVNINTSIDQKIIHYFQLSQKHFKDFIH